MVTCGCGCNFLRQIGTLILNFFLFERVNVLVIFTFTEKMLRFPENLAMNKGEEYRKFQEER